MMHSGDEMLKVVRGKIRGFKMKLKPTLGLIRRGSICKIKNHVADEDEDTPN